MPSRTDRDDFCLEVVVNNLKLIRIKAGLTQKELAKKSGVNFRMIQHYEQGDKDLNRAAVETVIKLARALDCNITDLIS